MRYLLTCVGCGAVVTALVGQGPPTRAGNTAKGKSGNVGLYQRQPPTPTGPAPKFADGTPDLSGVWLGGGSSDGDITRGLKVGSTVEMLPWAAALVKTRKSKED